MDSEKLQKERKVKCTNLFFSMLHLLQFHAIAKFSINFHLPHGNLKENTVFNKVSKGKCETKIVLSFLGHDDSSPPDGVVRAFKITWRYFGENMRALVDAVKSTSRIGC